jgi:hypothetical protein
MPLSHYGERASLRHEIPAEEGAYGWELKWDGLRAIACVTCASCSLSGLETQPVRLHAYLVLECAA